MLKKFNLTINKKKSKKGFTLVELVAVLAIIAILAATLAPRVSSYINDAKKVAVLNEAKTVITAFESLSYTLNVDEAAYDIDTLTTDYSDLISADSITKLPTTLNISECRDLLINQDFQVKFGEDGRLILE